MQSRLMLIRIIKIGSSVLWFLGLIGYFTLPEDWPIAVQRMGKIAMWFDRDALVIILLATSSAGFAWVTFSPAVMQWWRLRKEPLLNIDFPSEINSDAKYGSNKSSTTYIAKEGAGRVTVVKYYLDLTNTSTTKTARNVSIQVHQIDNPLPFPLERKLQNRNGETSVNIPPGYTDYFQIGTVHRQDRDAIGEHVQIVSRQSFDKIEKEWPEHTGFMLQLEGNQYLRLLRNNNLKLVPCLSA